MKSTHAGKPATRLKGPSCQTELAGRIRASWKAQAAGPEVCLERLRQQVLSDRVAFYFNVSARQKNGRLILEGEVERPEFRAFTRGVFQRLGYAAVADRIKVVPDALIKHPLFGVVAAPQALTWSHPDLSGIAMDEALLGEPVYLLKELSGAWLIKTFTGYWGYAEKDLIRPLTRDAFRRWINAPKAALARDFESGRSRLPAGCRLPIESWGAGAVCRLRGPSGEVFDVPRKLCWRNQRERDIKRAVEQALVFLDAPYQMGGKNRQTGIDCSGLVQLSYRALGVSLPRDAKQQYLAGYLIAPSVREALLPGDALFFMSEAGQVDHTGLYLGNQQMIHATPPRVRIQSLDPAAPDHFRRFDHDFLGAKRFWW
jgi:gamma-D-glutamyl-L-lysine dipeptidyl-peptidase